MSSSGPDVVDSDSPSQRSARMKGALLENPHVSSLGTITSGTPMRTV